MQRIQNPEIPLAGDILPHKPPMRWVGPISEANEEIVRAGLVIDQSHFRSGHFEEMDLVEALAQTGAVYPIWKSEEPVLPLFGAIESAKFADRMPELREYVDLDVDAKAAVGRNFRGLGTVWSEDREVLCEATVTGPIWPAKTVIKQIQRPEFVDGYADVPVHNPDLVSPEEIFGESDRVLLTGVTGHSGEASDGFLFTHDWHFAGHRFGGERVLPGIRQVAALKYLAQLHLIQAGEATEPLSLSELDGGEDLAVVFSRPVRPGERLDLHIDRLGDYRFHGIASVGGTAACQATLVLAEAA